VALLSNKFWIWIFEWFFLAGFQKYEKLLVGWLVVFEKN